MKELEFYKEYIEYLDWRLNEGQINKGKYALSKISKSSYDTFIKRLENDETFNEKICRILTIESRDKKIDDIIHEEVDESDEIDDFFDEFDI